MIKFSLIICCIVAALGGYGMFWLMVIYPAWSILFSIFYSGLMSAAIMGLLFGNYMKEEKKGDKNDKGIHRS